VNEPGALCYSELVTDDLARSRLFYAALFGWELDEAAGGAATIRTGGPVGGGMRLRADAERHGPPEWLPHFLVESVAVATAAAERAGGRVVASNGGRRALVADEQGARFWVRERPAPSVP